MREWKIWMAAGAVTLVLVLVLIGVFNRYREYRSDNEVRSVLEAQVLQLQDENSKIAEDVEYYSNTDNLEKELEKLSRITHIEGIGLYIARQENDEIRLSIEGSQLLSSQITKNIFELNELQLKQWMQGADLQIQNQERGIFIISYNNDFLGSGKLSEQKISNFIPKGRRIKPN